MRSLSALESFLTGGVLAGGVCTGIALALERTEIRGMEEVAQSAATRPSVLVPTATNSPPAEIARRLTEAVDASIDRIEPLDALPIDAGPDLPDGFDEDADIDDADLEDVGPEEDEEPETIAESTIACGPVSCPPSHVCCNASCGICLLPGESCTQRACNMLMTIDSPSCGPTTCKIGELCCDPVCGQCIRPGESCAPSTCLSPVTYPNSESCGMMTCNVGLVCCNPSCGICKPPGEPCSRELCD